MLNFCLTVYNLVEKKPVAFIHVYTYMNIFYKSILELCYVVCSPAKVLFGTISYPTHGYQYLVHIFAPLTGDLFSQISRGLRIGEQLTKCCEPLRKIRLSLGPCKTGFYWENSCSFGLRYVSWYKYLTVSLFFPTSVFGVGIFF